MSNKKIVKSGNKKFSQRFKHPDIVLQSFDEEPPSSIIDDFARLKSPYHNWNKSSGADDVEPLADNIQEAIKNIRKIEKKNARR